MKKRFSHSFTFLVCLFMFFSFSNVQAKTYVTSGLVSKNWTCPQMINGGYLTMDGKNVFCVEPHIIYKPNQKYEVISSRPSYISEDKAKRLSLISYYGTKYFKTERHYAAAQSLIWIELGEQASLATFKVDGLSVKPEMDEIMKYVNTHNLKPSFINETFTIEAGKTLELEDKNHVLERFTIEGSDGFDIKKEGNKLLISVSSKAPKSALINVNHYADSQNGSTIYYKIPGTSEGNGWQICGDFYVDKPIVSSFNLNIIHYETPELNTVQAKEKDIVQGNVTVLKKDATTLQGLENTLIDIHMDNHPLATNLSTNKEGEVSISFEKKYQAKSDIIEYITNYDNISPENKQLYKDLFKSYESAYDYASKQAKERLRELINNASYTFKAIEKQARNGYFSNNIETSLTTKDNQVQLSLENHHQTLEIELLKIDEITKEPIKDVIFGLYAKEDIVHPDGKTGILFPKDSLVSTFEKTNENGKSKLTNLYLGKYYVKEHQSPTSYTTNPQIIDINYQLTNTPIISVKKTITNNKTQIEFFKIDANTKQPLKDAHLQLINHNGEIIDEWVSSDIPHLITGLNKNQSYTLKESKAPEGYLLANPIHFIVKDCNEVQKVVMENKYIYSKVTFNKIGEVFQNFDDGFKLQPLAGCELSIYNLEHQLITTIASHQSTLLGYGKYYAKETKACEGYLIDSSIHEFEITSTDDTKLTIENKLPTFEVRLNKQFEDQKDYYEDVSFGLYTIDDIFISICHLDNQGNLMNVPQLPYGSYYLKEHTTHKNYVLDNNKYPFSIEFKDDKTSHIIININHNKPIINQLKRVNLTLHKKNDLNEPLENATFILMDQNHKVISQESTDKDGQIIFSNLVIGTYYIQEKEAPIGYQLDDQMIEVYLDKDTSLDLVNQFIPTTSTGDNQIIIPLSLLCLVSLGMLIYLKKKKGRSLL